MRLFWLVGSLALALLIGVLSLQVPAPAGADAPATDFSASRAMTDVREIAQRPHPVGSADHARVRAVLLQRMSEPGRSRAVRPAICAGWAATPRRPLSPPST